MLLTVTAPTRALLTAERTALNLLCHLSGVATLTARWADAIAGTGAAVRDTRKTTPGLRALEKYAVRCGGGVNHRMSLSDAALVKDNHVVAAGGVREAFDAVRAMWPGLPVEVEVDSLDQLDAVLDAGADLVLLDNFDVAQTRAAVAAYGGPGPAGVERRAHPRRRPRVRRDRRRLPRRRRPHPLRAGARHRPRPASPRERLMLLAIDVGNTNTVLGLFDGERLHRSWRIKTDARNTADEMVLTFAGLLARRGRGDRRSRCARRCPRCCARCG